jgi:malate dehydrogenase
MQKKRKIGLIGGGQIGGNLALLAIQKGLGDVVLYDIAPAEGLVKGKALDLNQLSAVDGYDCRVTGTTDWKDVAGSVVLVITAGVPR